LRSIPNSSNQVPAIIPHPGACSASFRLSAKEEDESGVRRKWIMNKRLLLAQAPILLALAKLSACQLTSDVDIFQAKVIGNLLMADVSTWITHDSCGSNHIVDWPVNVAMHPASNAAIIFYEAR